MTTTYSYDRGYADGYSNGYLGKISSDPDYIPKDVEGPDYISGYVNGHSKGRSEFLAE